MHDVSIEDAYEKWADELTAYATVLSGPDDAGDVVADTFATILRRERHDSETGESSRWRGTREPRAYLYRAVLNTARMRHRSGGRRRARELRVVSGPTTPPADSMLHDPTVLHAVRSLSVRQRAAIYLTYWEDLAIADTADLIGCSTGSAKRQLARARATLRRALDRKDGT